jgi:hypothetical protein
MSEPEQAPTVIGAGWVAKTSDHGYCGIPDGGAYAVPMPAEAQRSMAIGDARDERDRREAEADARDRWEAARIMGQRPRSVAEILAQVARRSEAADVIEARHRDRALAAHGDPAEALADLPRPPVADPPAVKRYAQMTSDPFMRRMIAEHDARVIAQARGELATMRRDAERRVAEIARSTDGGWL